MKIFYVSGLVKRKIMVLDLDETLVHSHTDGYKMFDFFAKIANARFKKINVYMRIRL